MRCARAERVGPFAGPRSRCVAVLLTALLAALSACMGGTDVVDQAAGGEFRFVAGTGKGQTIPQAERRSAPPAMAPRLDGAGSLDLASLRGKVVVLNFWASWCAPCLVESPDLDAAYRATRAAGVEFVGVATKDEVRAARAFVSRFKISYPNVFDPAGAVTLRFRGSAPRGFPYTIARQAGPGRRGLSGAVATGGHRARREPAGGRVVTASRPDTPSTSGPPMLERTGRWPRRRADEPASLASR